MAQFKNETMNLALWLDHYLWQGVDHFYLIDNGSTDHPMAVLRPYIQKGLVTYWYKPQPYRQVENYRWAFQVARMRWSTRWLIIADLDEFFFGNPVTLRATLPSFEYYNLIYCNWFMYGTSGCIQHPRDIRTANVHRQPIMDPINTKYIFKPAALVHHDQIWLHWLHYPNSKNKPLKKGYRIRTANMRIRLHHYLCQSQEFFEKVKRPRGDAMEPGTKWTPEFFSRCNTAATYYDDILKQLVVKNNQERK